MGQQLHPSLHYISPSQFLCDIVWLFGAMRQSITTRGKNIVQRYELDQDGIITWKCFIQTHRYGGDVDIYIAEQQVVLTVKYSTSYPGGMLQFLEDYEAAFMNIEYVKKKQQLSGTDSGEGLHTDQGKRAIFVCNFHLPNITNTLIEDVELHTSMWAEMVDVLRRKIARRIANALTTSRSRAHTVSTDEDLQSLVYALSADWNVGYKLWKTLEEDLRQRITKTRREHLPMNSGGDNSLKQMLQLLIQTKIHDQILSQKTET